MDPRLLLAGMTDGAIWFTPNASRLLSPHACRVTAAVAYPDLRNCRI